MARYIILLLCLLGAFALFFSVADIYGCIRLWLLPVGFAGSFLVIAIVIFLTLWISCLLVNTEKPQKKDNPYYRWLTGFMATVAVWILRMRIHTKGLEKMPKEGRFLLVCNHINDLDPVLLMSVFRKKQLAFISKRENNKKPFVGELMHKTMCQLINRENDREALKTILNCIRLLQEDEVSVAVFPEGYTSLDGLLHPFRHGVFKIAQKAKVPIVVCVLRNTNEPFQNIKTLKHTDVYLHILTVLQPEDFAGITAVELGTRIHTMMAEELGPELVLPQGEQDEED